MSTDPKNPYMVEGEPSPFSVNELREAIELTKRRSMVRAWKVCEEHTVGAETWEEAVAFAQEQLDVSPEDISDEPHEMPLTSTCWRDESMEERITYADAIIEATRIPCLVCSTEW